MNDLVSFEQLASLDKESLKEFFVKLEEKMKSLPEEQDVTEEIPIVHHFSKDVYAREMRQAKGILVLGKIHQYENLCIISQGEVSVLSVDGVKRLKAPYTFVASPGAQRVIYAHEDSIWTVVHGTSETDLEKIEEKFIAKNYDQFELRQKEELLKIGGG